MAVEIAKNLTLLGVNHLTLCDALQTTPAGLDWSILCPGKPEKEEKSRLEAATRLLKELSSDSKVRAVNVDITNLPDEELKDHDVFILTEWVPLESAILLNEKLRNNAKKLLIAHCNGLFGFVFNDFGDEFEVRGASGRESKSADVSNVIEGGVCICVREERHNFQIGDTVVLREFRGLDPAVSSRQFKVAEVLNPYTFKLADFDLSVIPPFNKNGRVEQVPASEKVAFRPLKESFEAAVLHSENEGQDS